MNKAKTIELVYEQIEAILIEELQEAYRMNMHSERDEGGFDLGLGGVDAEMDKGGGGVRHGRGIEADGSPVALDQFADLLTDFADADRIHPAVEKDPQGAVLDLVGECGSGTTLDEVIHAGEGKDPADLGGAIEDAEMGVAALELPGGLKNEPQHRRPNVVHVAEVAGQAGGEFLDLGADGRAEAGGGQGVETAGKDQLGAETVPLDLQLVHGSDAGGVHVFAVHLAHAAAENGGQPDEKHAAELVVVVHEEFELGPGDPPDDGGLGGADTGGGGAGIEDGDFPEGIAGVQFG